MKTVAPLTGISIERKSSFKEVCPIDLSYNDVKRGKPIHIFFHRSMQVVGEPINFIKTSFALPLRTWH
jgi:hypothetical protein